MCRHEDQHIHQHVNKVLQTMNNTTMHNDIVQAHQPHTSSTEANTPVTIDSSFFFHAGGQGYVPTQQLTHIHQYNEQEEEQGRDSDDHDEEEDSASENDNEHLSDNESQANSSDPEQSDSNPPYDSDQTDQDEYD